MAEKPSRFVCDLDRAVHLVRADSFLCRTHQEHREKPFADRNVRTFQHRADRNRELFAANPARPKSFASRSLALALLFQPINVGAFAALRRAVRTLRAIRPAQRLKERTSRVFVSVFLRQREQVQCVIFWFRFHLAFVLTFNKNQSQQINVNI